MTRDHPARQEGVSAIILGVDFDRNGRCPLPISNSHSSAVRLELSFGPFWWGAVVQDLTEPDLNLKYPV